MPPGHVVVTGHLGNIGSRITSAFGDRWYGIDKKNGPEMNLSNIDGRWTQALVGAEAVVHLAASPGSFQPAQAVIIDGFEATRNLFIAVAARCPNATVWFASSVAVSPRSFGAQHVGCGADGLYGQSKVYGEHLLRLAVAKGAIRGGVSVRIGYAPAPGTAPVPGAWAETVRMETPALIAAFNLKNKPTGYWVNNTVLGEPSADACPMDPIRN